MKNGEYHTQPKSIHRKKCESKQREIYHWRVERNGNVENKLFYSNLLRTDKLPGDITGIFALLLAIPPLYRPIYLLPDNSAACPSASPYSNSRVGQSTEPCNGEIFVVTWEKG